MAGPSKTNTHFIRFLNYPDGLIEGQDSQYCKRCVRKICQCQERVEIEDSPQIKVESEKKKKSLPKQEPDTMTTSKEEASLERETTTTSEEEESTLEPETRMTPTPKEEPEMSTREPETSTTTTATQTIDNAEPATKEETEEEKKSRELRHSLMAADEFLTRELYEPYANDPTRGRPTRRTRGAEAMNYCLNLKITKHGNKYRVRHKTSFYDEEESESSGGSDVVELDPEQNLEVAFLDLTGDTTDDDDNPEM